MAALSISLLTFSNPSRPLSNTERSLLSRLSLVGADSALWRRAGDGEGERVDRGGVEVEAVAVAVAAGEGAREGSEVEVEEAERVSRWDMVDFQPPPGEAFGQTRKS